MGLVVHSPGGSNTHPFGTAIEGVFNNVGRRSKSNHGRSRAVVKVVGATPAPSTARSDYLVDDESHF